MFQKQIGLNCDTTTDMICMSVIYYQPKHLYTRLLLDFFFFPKMYTFSNLEMKMIKQSLCVKVVQKAKDLQL